MPRVATNALPNSTLKFKGGAITQADINPD